MRQLKAHRLVVALAVLVGSLPLRAAEESYEVDGVHSTLVFKVKHLGASNFYGRFNSIAGSLVLDATDAKKSSVEIQVKAESVDTGNEKRDQHLRSPDFLIAPLRAVRSAPPSGPRRPRCPEGRPFCQPRPRP